ncbi:MAG: hypothetical protein ACRC2T_20890 [Thermoguttaceae bacterium]
MMKLRLFLTISVLFILSFTFGCGPKLPDGLPKLHKVQLKFTQEGAPLEKATITLIPQQTLPWAIGGSTDASGSVTLKTHGKYDGVPEGKYKITVIKFESEGELPTMANPNSTIQTFNVVDTKYATPDSTDLEIEVVAGKNSFDPLELGQAIREPVRGPGT